MFKGDLTEDEYIAISEVVNEKASKLGEKTGEMFTNLLKPLYPSREAVENYEPTGELIEIPTDELLDDINAISEDAKEKALQDMQEQLLDEGSN